jgi:hypothetical protein
VAIDEARCSRCNRAWIARDAGPDCFAHAFGIPSEHDWVVPVSAIAAALDGLDERAVGGGDNGGAYWHGQVNMKKRLRRALLGTEGSE